MANDKKITYRLFALSLNRRNVELAADERFSRVTPNYVLIYTTGAKPDGSIGVAAWEVDQLSEADRVWLYDCNTAILAEESEKRKPEVIRSISERMERLEEELRKLKDEEKKGTEDCGR